MSLTVDTFREAYTAGVILYDTNHAATWVRGNSTKNLAPLPGLLSTHIFP